MHEVIGPGVVVLPDLTYLVRHSVGIVLSNDMSSCVVKSPGDGIPFN